MANTNYLDKRKIAGIEKRARGLAHADNTLGNVLAGAIIVAFCVSTVHLMGALRGWGFLGWTLGILSSIATEGAFLFHRYRSYPRHENDRQKWSALAGLSIALVGSLFYFGADMLLLLGLLDTTIAGPLAIGVMGIVLLSAIVTESVYELSSHVAAYERQKREDALEVLRISDNTRLELDRGDLEIMKAHADLALAATFQRADEIRSAIPAAVERLAGKADLIDPDAVKDELENLGTSNNGRSPKVKSR